MWQATHWLAFRLHGWQLAAHFSLTKANCTPHKYSLETEATVERRLAVVGCNTLAVVRTVPATHCQQYIQPRRCAQNSNSPNGCSIHTMCVLNLPVWNPARSQIHCCAHKQFTSKHNTRRVSLHIPYWVNHQPMLRPSSDCNLWCRHLGERKREKERACKVMREGGGKGGGANAGVRWSKYTRWLSCITLSPSPPPPRHPPLPILAAALRVPLHGLGCQTSSAECGSGMEIYTALANFDRTR